MTTHIKTKVFIIWASKKGGKWIEEVYFDKEKAIKMAKSYKELNPKWNFRVEEKATGDCLTWTEE